MSINKKSLRALIKESLEQARSEQAIDHAKNMRKDGLSFEDFITILLDYLENQTDQQWSEEHLSDDWNYYDEWLKGSDPLSIAAEYLADAPDYYQENKMNNINLKQLRALIKEALGVGGEEQPGEEVEAPQESKLNEDDVQMDPGGNWGQPLAGEEEADLRDVESLAMDIVQLLDGIEHNDAVDVLTLAAETLGLAPPEEEEETRPIGFVREVLRLKLIEESYKRRLEDAVKNAFKK